MAERNAVSTINAVHRNLLIERRVAMRMGDHLRDECGKCGAEIDGARRVDYTLKDGTRVCDSCFVKGTTKPYRASGYFDY
jgi:hypothetical protein